MRDSENQMKNRMMIAFLFDSGKIEDSFYGNIVFRNFIEGMEIATNKYKAVFSIGDVVDENIHIDINPILIRDNLCSVSNDNQGNFKDWLFAFLVEDIEKEVAISIDQRMKSDFPAYIGMTSVDMKSKDARKQFWKKLIRSFSMEDMTITAFTSVEEGGFMYSETATSKGFHINLDGFYGSNSCSEDGMMFSTRQSSFVNNVKQLKLLNGKSDADRGIMNMNFSLVKEVCIAGVQIWKSIEDIDNAYITKNTGILGAPSTEYIFTSLYQAAQGIERLLKVILELLMYGMQEGEEKAKILKLLTGHNHPAMWDYIQKNEEVILKPLNRRLLNTLNEFYSKARYHRYNDFDTDVLELDLIRDFGKDLENENFDKEVKHLYGKALGQLSQTFYQIIESSSTKLNIYVYELPLESTANYVLKSYYGEDLYDTLQKIKLSKKELLWFLISKGNVSSSKYKYPELRFDESLMPEAYFLKDLLSSGSSNFNLYSFVTEAYDELFDESILKERIRAINNLVNDIV